MFPCVRCLSSSVIPSTLEPEDSCCHSVFMSSVNYIRSVTASHGESQQVTAARPPNALHVPELKDPAHLSLLSDTQILTHALKATEDSKHKLIQNFLDHNEENTSERVVWTKAAFRCPEK